MVKFSFAFVFISIFILFSPPITVAQEVFGGTSQEIDLKRAIEEKSKELLEVHQKIQETQDNLIAAENKSKSLSQELKKFNYTIGQLNLSIKSNLINIDKLEFEIDSLNLDINRVEEEIKLKEKAVNKILREMQIKDGEGLVVLFLKSQSLSEGLAEIDNLNQIKNSLSKEVADLSQLKENLDGNKNQSLQKKKKVEAEHQNAQARKRITEEQKIERNELLALTKNQQKIYEELIDELSRKQTEIAIEIEKIEAELRRKIDPSLLPPERPGVLEWPVESGFKKITQNYGATTFARYGYKGKWHNGIDIGSPFGTPVLAAGEGTVVNIGDQDRFCPKGAYGKYIVILHGNNLVTLYGHIFEQSVNPGDRVSRGQVIGYMGSTGYSTGPHLHFTVYDSNTFAMRKSATCGPMPSGGDINPMIYL